MLKKTDTKIVFLYVLRNRRDNCSCMGSVVWLFGFQWLLNLKVKRSKKYSYPKISQLGPGKSIVGGCPMHCGRSSFPGLDPLDSSSTPQPSWDNLKCLQALSMSLVGHSLPRLRTMELASHHFKQDSYLINTLYLILGSSA